ncbi:MAG TPA: molybdopterin-dependent oxidoreductase [Acidimicrobiales bacterium]
MPDGPATELPATPEEADRGPAPGGACAGGERPPVVRRARPRPSPTRAAAGAGAETGAEAEARADGEGAPIGRRVVLGMVGLGALGVLVGERVQGTIERALRPVSRNDPTGLTSFVPTGGRFRIYSVTPTMPSRSTGEYRLRVDGLVDRPLDLSYDQLLDLPQTELVRDFQCVTGWRVPDVPWQGVRVSELLDRAGVQPGATHLRIHSFDGAYTESLTLEQARRDDVIVAHSMMGGPVSREHGGPVRLYVAPMYGYKSLKWLDRIEVVDRLVPGYWEERGYDVDAWVGESNGRRDEPIEA